MPTSDRPTVRRFLLGAFLAFVVTGHVRSTGGPTPVTADDRAGRVPTPAHGSAERGLRSTVDAPAQITATAVPTFAPCPTPTTPLPPGLWPIPRYDGVRAVWTNDSADEPRLELEVCIRNDGPSTWGPMTIALQGCVERAMRIRVQAIEEYYARCFRLPLEDRVDAPCQVMHDADCENQTPFDIDRRWNGRIDVPPSPTPDPQGTPTTTLPATPTDTATSAPSATPTLPRTATLLPSVPLILPLVRSDADR